MAHKKFNIGDKCNWVGQPERLVYLGLGTGVCRGWHQFARVESPHRVWCEVRPEDLDNMELTPDAGVVD